MNKAEFAKKTIDVLNGHTNELDSISDGITGGAAIDQKVIIDGLKELSAAAVECRQTLDFYDEKEPMPAKVNTAMSETLRAITDALSGLVLYFSKLN